VLPIAVLCVADPCSIWRCSLYQPALYDVTDRSLMAKKADGIKESTDSNATVEEEETRG